MPAYTTQETDDMATVGGWTGAQVGAAINGTGGTGHTTDDLLRVLMTALATCLSSKAAQIRDDGFHYGG